MLRRIASGLRDEVVATLRDLVVSLFPVACAGCGSPSGGLCPRCVEALGLGPGPGSERGRGDGGSCAIQAGSGERGRATAGRSPPVRARPLPRSAVHGAVPGYFALDYHGVPARVLLAFKNRNRTDLARALGEVLAGLWESVVGVAVAGTAHPGTLAARGPAFVRGNPAPVVAVAIPTRSRAWRRRGYRPVSELLRAAHIAEVRALRWRRQPADQLGLGRAERERNLHGALEVRPRYRRAQRPGVRRRLNLGEGVVIVDDVVTTGATVAEAQRAFRDADIPVIAVIALAYANRDAPGK